MIRRYEAIVSILRGQSFEERSLGRFRTRERAAAALLAFRSPVLRVTRYKRATDAEGWIRDHRASDRDTPADLTLRLVPTVGELGYW